VQKREEPWKKEKKRRGEKSSREKKGVGREVGH